MKKIKLSTKSKTLEDLTKIIKSAKVLPIYRFNLSTYKKNKNKILVEINKKFKSHVIIRSSSKNEDSLKNSNAGKFLSILNVNVNDKDNLERSIQKVAASLGRSKSKDEIFVQPMLNNVTMSGVIFTCDLDTLSPYQIINYDESGSTNSVTSGNSNKLKSFINFKNQIKYRDSRINKIINASIECEKIFQNKFLDIEFAFSKNQLYIFQVRAIVKNKKENLSNINLKKNLRKLEKKIEKLNRPHPNLLGNKALFSVMTDWNPAEIIGLRPKMLALSLYKELITDETWAYQRDNYGYRRLRSHPLLVSFLGVPYIDVRVSFNSFIPKSLNEKIATKLVNYYLNELSINLNKHDKVEFEIIYSCFYFGLNKKLLKLLKYGFKKNELQEIEKSLLGITNKIINIKNGLYKKDLEKSYLLEKKFNEIVNSDLSIIDKIYWLIKDVKRYGTLPFAGVARAGFIAIQILKSFVHSNIFTNEQYDKFLKSINTVSKQLSNDFKFLKKKEFLKIYGHLRPGTYDILSPRYDESYEMYFDSKNNFNVTENNSFKFSKFQKQQISKLINKNKIDTNFKNLIIFIKEAIEGREYVKFLFSRHLSKILNYIEKLGNKYKINKNDLAYLDIQKIINLYASLDNRDLKNILINDIQKNKEFYLHTKAIKLPNVIKDKKDIFSFFLEENEPNFITLKRVKSAVVTEKDIMSINVKDKIVCIKSADPGYDYLFSKSIAGLITCYGGANSHMAIRCAELGIPAVIGCGENSFTKYCQKKNLEIDAANRQVIII
ncbi:PEP/pyruvate-binding domain-containing protein [Candidatus Pelagibacter sp. HIMB1495]|uniref:PEP/pyruvate-binding domain-containing protein n=1 Tax=unclassified Candidatus Pelagibacter TaxID=2647897 RepID=UPI003F83F0E4